MTTVAQLLMDQSTVSDVTWMEATQSLRDKLKISVMFCGGFHFSNEGCANLLGLITEMSQKLDAAVIMQGVDDVITTAQSAG